jgi:hypothetical protein
VGAHQFPPGAHPLITLLPAFHRLNTYIIQREFWGKTERLRHWHFGTGFRQTCVCSFRVAFGRRFDLGIQATSGRQAELSKAVNHDAKVGGLVTVSLPRWLTSAAPTSFIDAEGLSMAENAQGYQVNSTW